MTYEEVKRRAFLPPPEAEQHPGPPPGWVPPPPPKEMEPECEAVITGALRVEGEKQELAGGVYTATEDNQSALYARAGAKVSLTGTVLEKTGGALVQEYTDEAGQTVRLPMLRGINSTVLSNGEGTEVRLKDCRIVSHCEPGDMALEASNGVFAVFRGKAFLENVDIALDGGFAHGLYDSQFGTICAEGCRVVTTGHCASALATDQPGGDLFIRNTWALCRGPASAGVYVDGGSHAEVTACDLRSLQAEGAVLCNDGFLRLSDTVIRGALESRRCPQHWDHIGNGTVILRDCRVAGDLAACDDCALSVRLENSAVTGRMHHVALRVGYGSRVVFTGDSELEALETEELSALSALVPCTVTYLPTEALSGDYDLGNLRLRQRREGGAV